MSLPQQCHAIYRLYQQKYQVAPKQQADRSAASPVPKFKLLLQNEPHHRDIQSGQYTHRLLYGKADGEQEPTTAARPKSLQQLWQSKPVRKTKSTLTYRQRPMKQKPALSLKAKSHTENLYLLLMSQQKNRYKPDTKQLQKDVDRDLRLSQKARTQPVVERQHNRLSTIRKKAQMFRGKAVSEIDNQRKDSMHMKPWDIEADELLD